MGKTERKRKRGREKTNEELSIIKPKKIFFQKSYTLQFFREKYRNFESTFVLLMIKIAKQRNITLNSSEAAFTQIKLLKIIQKFQNFILNKSLLVRVMISIFGKATINNSAQSNSIKL